MYKPYTYLIKCIPENKFYYGVKYAKDANPDTFWINYFTSSKEVHRLLEKYGSDSFQFEIRKTFKDESSARSWEQKVLRRIRADIRNDFINKIVPGANFGFESGENNPMKDPEVVKKNHKKRNATLKLKYKEGHNWKTKEHSKRVSRMTSIRNSKMNAVRNKEFSKIVVECPHCNKVGRQPGMSIYHFNKCKKKDN